MTISSTTRKAGPFSGNNVTVAFPFTFKVFDETDIVVVATDASDVETTQTLTTHYTVSLNADQDASPGGTVTMLSAPASGTLLTITSDVPELQAVALTNNGGFYPAVINGALDRLTILIQQVAEETSRAVKVQVSSSTDPDALIASLEASEAAAAASAAEAASSAAAAAAAIPSGSLGYTPVNITGDTMTGPLLLPSINLNGSGAYTSFGNVVTKTHGTASGNVPLVGTKSATEAVAGLVELATQAEAEAGTDNTVVLTALRAAQEIRALNLTAGTATATTSGTAVGFTSIPSWVKRITVSLNGVSTTGTSAPIIQIGDSDGYENADYLGVGITASSGGVTSNQNSSGFNIGGNHTAATVISGSLVLTLQDAATNTWACFGTLGRSDAAALCSSGGAKSLSATLDRVQITTAGGADTFDAGSINILYE